jgi:superfamily II DNA/RNA helicase
MSNLAIQESSVELNTNVVIQEVEKNQPLFTDFELPAVLLETLADNKFVNPTPIQVKSIPLILQGKDLLGTAQTGTGKTLAFSLPIVAKLIADPTSSVLILVPTRELAQQVTKTFNMLVKKQKSLRTVLLIGGEYIRQQMTDLAKNPRIIIGTPGRVIDHLERGTFVPASVKYLILDEMDRMLDMGFGLQLDEILSYLPKDRQALMFSATLPSHISKVAQRYLTNPSLVAIGAHSQPVAKIKQDVLFVKQAEKFTTLVDTLTARQGKTSGSVIIFVRTKMDADDICEQLRDQRFRASAMHGDLRQAKRQRVLNDFRTRKLDILVATDIAARGIDIAHIELVINYELPQATEDYIHRIGRTARGGAEGASLSLVAPFEQGKWKDILRLTNPEAAKEFAVKRPERSSDRPFKKFGHQDGPRRSFGGSNAAPAKRSFGGEKRSYFNEGADQNKRSYGPDRRSSDRRDSGFEQRPERRFGSDQQRPERGGFERDRNDRGGFDRGDRSDRAGFAPRSDRGAFKNDRPSRDGGDRGDRKSYGRTSSFQGRDQAPRKSMNVLEGRVVSS